MRDACTESDNEEGGEEEEEEEDDLEETSLASASSRPAKGAENDFTPVTSTRRDRRKQREACSS